MYYTRIWIVMAMDHMHKASLLCNSISLCFAKTLTHFAESKKVTTTLHRAAAQQQGKSHAPVVATRH